jgi:hypothetical protein
MIEYTRTSGLPGFGRIRPASKYSWAIFEELASTAVLIDKELRLNQIAEARRRMPLDGESHTSLSFDESGQKPESSLLARQSFLLVACTNRVFTAHGVTLERVSAGYSGIPAYSQLL